MVIEGPADDSRVGTLRRSFDPLSVIGAADGATREPATLNPIVDEADANWILLVRSGERVSDALASEVATSASADPKAWGYRIAGRALYCGRALAIGRGDPGEIRLFHRRKARLQPDGRMKVQGTVVRLASALEVVLYATEHEHLDTLRTSGREPVGSVRRLARWAAAVVRNGPRALAFPTRRYLWIEAGWREGVHASPGISD